MAIRIRTCAYLDKDPCLPGCTPSLPGATWMWCWVEAVLVEDGAVWRQRWVETALLGGGVATLLAAPGWGGVGWRRRWIVVGATLLVVTLLGGGSVGWRCRWVEVLLHWENFCFFLWNWKKKTGSIPIPWPTRDGSLRVGPIRVESRFSNFGPL
jgi:hypothetical protein